MDASEKRMIIWFTPHPTTTLPKRMFIQKLVFKSSLPLNGQCGIQVCPPTSDDLCLLFYLILLLWSQAMSYRTRTRSTASSSGTSGRQRAGDVYTRGFILKLKRRNSRGERQFMHVIICFYASFSLLCFLFLFYCIPKVGWKAKKSINSERKQKRMRPKKRELHELPYTEMVKSGTVVYSPQTLVNTFQRS